MERLFEGKSCIADYQPERNTVYFTLNGYVNVEEHKKMYLQILKFTETNLVVAFIYDFKQLKGTFTQLNDWIIETLSPCVKRGLRMSCMVMNEDAFTLFAAKSVKNKSTTIQTQIFKSKVEAEKWVDDEMKKQPA